MEDGETRQLSRGCEVFAQREDCDLWEFVGLGYRIKHTPNPTCSPHPRGVLASSPDLNPFPDPD